MGALWRTLVPVGLLLVAAGFVAGAVAAAGSDEPPPRQPVEMVTAPTPDDASSRTPSATPDTEPTSRPRRTSEVPVVTPRPGIDDDRLDDRGEDRDDRDDRDGGDDADERDDD